MTLFKLPQATHNPVLESFQIPPEEPGVILGHALQYSQQMSYGIQSFIDAHLITFT